MARKKLLWALAAMAALAAVILISTAYSRFASRQIYQESVSHLEEIYTQINGTFRSTVTKNWRLLRGWRPYIEDVAVRDPQELAAFVQEEREDWHFTGFYLLDQDGQYITEKGDTGYLNLGEELPQLTEARENIVADTVTPGTDQITVFAVPVTPGQYQGFDYTAMGISFSSADMTAGLSIQAFDGQSNCFVTYPDGRILFSSLTREEQPYNFLAYLRREGAFSDFDAEDVAADWKAGGSSTLVCRLGGVRHYLSYQPVGFSDWVLVSTAPVDVVNASMNRFTLVTLAVMALLFSIIAVGVAVFLVLGNRRRMQEKNREIRAREQLFDLLTENTEDIFILFSPEDFTAEYVSPNLERVLGLEEAAIRGDVRPLLFAEEGLSPELLAEVPMGGAWTGEQEMVHAQSREPRWFKQLLHRCSLGRQDQFILMLSDRTKERQMVLALDDALHTAKAANEAKSNFLSNMSHDIRTPMNAIVGFAVLLGRDAENPDRVREYTRKIASSSQHLLSLINDILDMSKIESGKTSLNMQEFSLPQLVDELYTMMLPQAKAKGQSFELYTKGSLPETLLGDKLRLNQVLINLLSNAVKYTQEGGQIGLTVQRLSQNASHRAHLRFIISDNGFGMSEGFVRTIFDPFAREITDATQEIQGTGLGMAITKNIVDLMGGTISVESQLGKGSTFTVEAELAVAGLEQDDAFWLRHSITRLLAVDDEEDICLGIQSAMEDTGVEVAYATSGAKAVEMAAQACQNGQEFHIILTDWQMPGMDGLETARRIREAVGDDVPILILTSHDLEDAREAGKGQGIDMFLPKPFFRSSLQRAMSQLLDGSGGEPQPEQEDFSLAGLKVLAAEDNEINAEILQELLEMEGMECQVVPNGKAAVERFAASAPGEFDLIFMDVQMPVMNGYEATKAIRAGSHPLSKAIPIIAMTANAFEEDVQTALAAGMNAHTAKPIDLDKLKATVAKLQGVMEENRREI